MANRKGVIDSAARASKSYSMDEFMGAYLRGELELKPDGKVKANHKTGGGRAKWCLVPANLAEIPEDLDIDSMYKWTTHKRKDGTTYPVFGLRAQDWKAKGYLGKLVRRYVAEIENELTRVYEVETNFDTQFEQAMLEWEVGEDKN